MFFYGWIHKMYIKITQLTKEVHMHNCIHNHQFWFNLVSVAHQKRSKMDICESCADTNLLADRFKAVVASQ